MLLLFSILICFCFESIPGNPSVNPLVICPEPSLESPALLRHPTNCREFFLCQGYLPVLMTCPTGLHFDTKLNVCNWPWAVDCTEKHTNLSPDQETTEATHQETTKAANEVNGVNVDDVHLVHLNLDKAGEIRKKIYFDESEAFDDNIENKAIGDKSENILIGNLINENKNENVADYSENEHIGGKNGDDTIDDNKEQKITSDKKLEEFIIRDIMEDKSNSDNNFEEFIIGHIIEDNSNIDNNLEKFISRRIYSDHGEKEIIRDNNFEEISGDDNFQGKSGIHKHSWYAESWHNGMPHE